MEPSSIIANGRYVLDRRWLLFHTGRIGRSAEQPPLKGHAAASLTLEFENRKPSLEFLLRSDAKFLNAEDVASSSREQDRSGQAALHLRRLLQDAAPGFS